MEYIMSNGIAVRAYIGLIDPEFVFIKLKGGSRYRFGKPLSPEGNRDLIAAIKAGKGKVKLKYWTRIELEAQA
jgi:hypothetical protein